MNYKKFFLVFFLALSIAYPSLGMSPVIHRSTPAVNHPTNENFPITMGIELELQGIQYENPGITILDHLRLYESKKKKEGTDKPNWYLESDGSGNIEFVSRPFNINDHEEEKILWQSVIDMHKLLLEIISSSKIESVREGNFKFQAKKGTETSLGKWVLEPDNDYILPEEKIDLDKVDYINIDIMDITCKVRPQATFEFPLRLIKKYTKNMSKHGKIQEALKKLEHLKVKDDKDGLGYLIILYKNFLNDDKPYEEMGPKEKLPLMSRKSFSSMYQAIKGIGFQDYLEEIKDQKLFKIPFSFNLEGEELSDRDEIKEIINHITLGEWVASIISPQNKNLQKKVEEFWSKMVQDKSTKAKELIYHQLRINLFNYSEDLLSPPPFLPNTYSMGKYRDNSKNSTGIIEMRGYPTIYTSQMRMGVMLMSWLETELESAKRQWENPKKMEGFTDAYKFVLNNMKKSAWYTDEEEIKSNWVKLEINLNKLSQGSKGNLLSKNSEIERENKKTIENVKEYFYSQREMEIKSLMDYKKEWVKEIIEQQVLEKNKNLN